MPDNSDEKLYMFKPREPLEAPPIMPKAKKDKSSAIATFFVPGFLINNDDELNHVSRLSSLCGSEVEQSFFRVYKKKSGIVGTTVSIGFYYRKDLSSELDDSKAMEIAHRLCERFISLLSFCSGLAVPVLDLQVDRLMKNGHHKKQLHPAGRASVIQSQFDYPRSLIDGANISPKIFTSLMWLRRGMMEKDPIHTFHALMLCLEIMGDEYGNKVYRKIKCPHCQKLFKDDYPLIGEKVKDFLISKLGASKEDVEELWKFRNTIIAHGGKTVTTDLLVKLTELKFAAAELAFKGIKYALEMPPDEPPFLNDSFFVTDAFMYLE